MLCAMVLAGFACGEETEGEPPCAFGYCMGQAMEGEPDMDDGLLVTVVEDDPTFDVLYVSWAPVAGVCAVTGHAGEGAFATFAAIVTGKYGEPTADAESIKIWTEPREGIDLISVASAAGKAVVIYIFANYDACVEEVQARWSHRF